MAGTSYLVTLSVLTATVPELACRVEPARLSLRGRPDGLDPQNLFPQSLVTTAAVSAAGAP